MASVAQTLMNVQLEQLCVTRTAQTHSALTRAVAGQASSSMQMATLAMISMSVEETTCAKWHATTLPAHSTVPAGQDTSSTAMRGHAEIWMSVLLVWICVTRIASTLLAPTHAAATVDTHSTTMASDAMTSTSVLLEVLATPRVWKCV